MIGYITKVSSFGALARYLESGTGGQAERRVLWTTARYVSGDLLEAAAEMNLTGHLTETEALGYHLTIGFDPADWPTRDEMEYAVQRTLGALGLADNMAITVAHGDAYFAHTHTMIARWDYWTARVVEASNSYYVITRVMRELEDELGMEPAPRPYWERAGQETEVQDTELRNTEGGREESSPIRLIDRLPMAARNQARAALQTATSWGHLQELHRKEGLRFVRGRDNLLIAKGEVTVRAGQITGGTSLAKLEARFGQTLREHEAEVAGRLTRPVGDAPRKAIGQEKARSRFHPGDDNRTDGDNRKGRNRAGEEKLAEDLLLALAKAFRRREEAYQLTRRSALLEAEEADVASLQQDLQQVETRGTALLERLLQTGGLSSRKGFSNGASGGSELPEARRRREEARKLWRKAAWTVERQETPRSVTPEGLLEVLGEDLAGKISSEEERRLLALLSEHCQTAEQAAELFLPKATNARMSEEGNPSSPPETGAADKESSMRRNSNSEESHSEEVLTEGQSRQDGAEMSRDPSATTLPAEAMLKETLEAIREARLGFEERLRGWQRQVQGGEGAAELERRLRRVLGRLADRDLKAASRFARRYILILETGVEPRVEPGAESEPGAVGGGESESTYEGGVLEGQALREEVLQSPEVQEALRRSIPEGVQPEGQRGPDRKSPSRSR